MSTYVHQDAGQSPVSSILGTGLAILRDRWRAFRERRVQQQTIAMLHSLSDRDLKDIGMTRGEIESAVRGPWMRERMGTHY